VFSRTPLHRITQFVVDCGACQMEQRISLFQENLDAGEDLGASIAVVRNGVFLVDLWGGWVDIEHGMPSLKTPSPPPGR
jgi:hypothetical protein